MERQLTFDDYAARLQEEAKRPPEKTTYDVCETHHGGVATSVAANPSDAAKARQALRVYRHLRAIHPLGATCDEMEVALKVTHQSLSPTITRLVKDGALIRGPERRKTRSGRNAFVHIANINATKEQQEGHTHEDCC